MHASLLGPVLAAVLVVAVASTGSERSVTDLVHESWAYSEPMLVAHPDGDGDSGALAWLGFDGERDHVCAAFFAGGEWSEMVEVSSGPGEYFPPVLTPFLGEAGERDFWVIWSARVDGDLDLWARRIGPGGMGAPERISADAAPDVEPAVATSPDGDLVVAWQSLRDGNQEILARRRTAEGWDTTVRVTRDASSDLQPALGFDADGRAWLAWSTWRHGSYADGNYEVYAGRLPAPGEAGESGEHELIDARLVSTSGRADLFPRFARVGEHLGLVWTESGFSVRRIGQGPDTPLETVAYDHWRDKSYRVAWLEGDAFGEPQVARALRPDGEPLEVSDFAAPVAAANGKGLWLVHQTLFEKPAVRKRWGLAVSRVRGTGSSPPFDASAGVAGPGGRFDAAWIGGRLLAVDTASSVEGGESLVDKWGSWLRVREVRTKGGGSSLEAKALQKLAFEAAPAGLMAPSAQRAGDEGAREREHVTLENAGDAELTAYFGNLHLHSDLSTDGRGHEGTPALNYQVVHDLAGLDFAGLSDHVEWFQQNDWWTVRKTSALWNRPGHFVTLPGYEWTSFKHGHKNVYFPDDENADSDATSKSFGATPDDLWAHLGERAALTIPHHPSHKVNEPTDWSYRNDQFQRLVEIFQVRGSYEYDGAPYQFGRSPENSAPDHSVRDALALGHRLGIIASPDHGGGRGLAGVWGAELTRPGLFEALHARRTFGTTGARMTLWLTVAGAAQGEERERPSGDVALHAEVTGTLGGLQLTIVCDGEDLARFEFDGQRAVLDWTDTRPPAAGTRYYYLRARQGDGHLGWTSPVWLDAPR